VSTPRSWYDVLGVPVSADADEIRSAHRAASKAAHPDAGGTTEQFQLVQQAYEVLADPERRSAHDRERRGEPASPPAPTSTAATPSSTAPSYRPAAAAPPAPAGGCLNPWVAIGAGVIVVVAVLVTIATLSSSSGPSTSTTSRVAGGPPLTEPAAGSAPSSSLGGNPSAAVTTVVLDDLPDGFPRGHVPLPTGARLADVVVASAPGQTPTVTIRAPASATDADRAALSYASALIAAGWSPTTVTDDQALPDGTEQRSFVDADGSALQFVVGPAADGGLTFLIGFTSRS
jgi:hypothetical protein